MRKPFVRANFALRTVVALMLETLAFQIMRPLSIRLIKSNFHVSLSRRRSTTVPLETSNLLELFSTCQGGAEINRTLNYANRNGFSFIPSKMDGWKIDENCRFSWKAPSYIRHQTKSFLFNVQYFQARSSRPCGIVLPPPRETTPFSAVEYGASCWEDSDSRGDRTGEKRDQQK